jgi:hypothetical protein
MTFELWLLTWNVSYLFDRTPHYRPWLSWLGLDIRRLAVEDFVRVLILEWRNFVSQANSEWPN